MRQLMNLWKGMASAVAGGLLLCACSAEEDAPLAADGKGFVKIGLSADTAFGAATKAVDESAYQDKNKYTVQLLDAKGEKVERDLGLFSEIENPLTLSAGAYVLKAFYNEEYKDVAASQDGFYVEGATEAFNITADQETSVSIKCAPTSVKVAVAFADEMKEYFDDYYMTFNTKALGSGIYQELKNTDPLYLVVENKETVKAQIALKKKGETGVEFIEKSYVMSPGEAKRINIKPTVKDPATGGLGLTIEVDDKVETVEVPITIPAWE